MVSCDQGAMFKKVNSQDKAQCVKLIKFNHLPPLPLFKINQPLLF